MTEQEAMNRWCPFARIGKHDGPFNRGPQCSMPSSPAIETSVPSCVGSACMAWRWVRWTDGTRHGFCGMAGFPPEM